MELKDCYQVGDLVEDPQFKGGIVISVTRNKLIVKTEYGTSTYTEIEHLESFKEEVKVIMNIGSVLRQLLPYKKSKP